MGPVNQNRNMIKRDNGSIPSIFQTKILKQKKNLWVAFYGMFSMIFMTGAFDIFRGIMMSRISVIQHYLKIFSP